MRCFARLCLAPERTLLGCLGPGVASSLGFSTSCGGVRRASVGRSRLGICSPPPAFPGPPQAHTRTSLSARDPASAPASASAPPYKTSHDASSSACARIPACPRTRVVMSWHAMHDERWTCVPRHHPVRPHPLPLGVSAAWPLPSPARCAHPASAAAYPDAGRHTSTSYAMRTCTSRSTRDAPHGAGVSCVSHAYVAARSSPGNNM
ncbi:hypothetical protein B0H14DRAFT_3508202 [Mycena olivaceomarginata]|nr:hypothetical protein B0H14DRAFT_3508202 [Mycena olivaceomarginata]